MKKVIAIAFISCLVGVFTRVSAQFSNLEFVENKGQWNDAVKFKGELSAGAFFLTNKGFSVVQHNLDDLLAIDEYLHGTPSHINLPRNKVDVATPKNLLVHSHAYNVNFLGTGSPSIIPDKALPTFNNYFIGSDAAKWASNCHIFQAVTYKNMYEKIDVRYYTNNGQLKYDVIVNPGGKLSNVALRYEGVNGISLKNGELRVKTSVGEFKELAPYAYQVINGEKKVVNCRFKVVDTTLTFLADQYDPSATLIIDPTLIFSTFTGSTSDNWGYTATYGPDGSFYAGGIVFGTGFKTSPGAFQTGFQGGDKGDTEGIGAFDIGIMKFTPDGTNRSYATYLGGIKGNEQPHSMVVDPQGELVVAGRTNSTDFPVKGYSKKGGSYDIIVTKFNASGTGIVGSTQIGGEGFDGVNIEPKYPLPGPTKPKSIRRNYGDDARSEVIVDGAGNIMLVSNTQSADFPITSGVFQGTFGGGKQDGVILKLSPDLSSLMFSTFLGGQSEDACFVLAVNPTNGNVYIGGNTVSNNLPGDKTGVRQATFQGGETDGFVSIITPDGRSLLKTSYMGTGGNDMLYGIQFDKFGYPYIMGTTSGNWPVQNAGFSQNGGKQFIAKLRPDLSAFEYSTVFGTNSSAPNLSPIAFLVDRCENVYVSGWGGSVNQNAGYPTSGTSGLSTTPDAIKRTTDGSDFYFFVLERNAGSQLYGSFFGQVGGFGEHVDGGTSRFDKNGVIYQALCANCGRSVPFPTTPGVWAPSNGTSQQCNLAAVKIAFNLAGVAGSIKSSIVGSTQDTVGCVPLTVIFRDTIAAGKRYTWNFGDGTPEVVGNAPEVQHTFTAIGTYRVMHVSIDSGKCNVADTVYTNIKVRTFRANLDFTPRKFGQCDLFNYQFFNNTTVTPPTRTFTDSSFTWTFGDNTPAIKSGLNTVTHSYPGPGIYNVNLLLSDTNFCNAPVNLTKTLRIATNVKAVISTPAKGCAPYDALFDNQSEGGADFFWDFGDNTTSTEVSPVHTYDVPGTYTIKMIAIDSATCNIIDSTSVTIVVNSKPTASFGYTPDPPQTNTAVIFSNNSIGARAYTWFFGDGETLKTTNNQSVQHIYNESNTFTAQLVAVNEFGCTDTASQVLQAKVDPLLDVPNAFTPNGDGINDKVMVRGYGISRMLWRIYNRWGAVVFESTDRNQGWDGYYKGSLQPQDVYHYTLDVQYSDNTTYHKNGDITLLR